MSKKKYFSEKEAKGSFATFSTSSKFRCMFFVFCLHLLVSFVTLTVSKHIQIQGESFEVGELGQGTFATTFLTLTEPPSVIKVGKHTLDQEEVLRKEKGWKPSQEIQVLKKLNELEAMDIQHGKPLLKLKYHPGCTLFDCFETGFMHSQKHFESALQATISALHALHQQGIVHQDCHQGNVLFKTEPLITAKLIDFGLSQDLQCDQSDCMDKKSMQLFQADFKMILKMFWKVARHFKLRGPNGIWLIAQVKGYRPNKVADLNTMALS